MAVVMLFALSMAINLAVMASDWSIWAPPAMLTGWYVADFLSGVIHMTMDYRPCRTGVGLDRLYFYEGSRESADYLALRREVMARLSPFERIVFDFKTHHPRPQALGRRTLWRQIGPSVIAGALPASILLNAAWLLLALPGWLVAGGLALLVGGAFAQYFRGTLHRDENPGFVKVMRVIGLLMAPARHQRHHDTLTRDFSTNCGWSNPVVNWLFRQCRARGMMTDAGLEPTG